MKKRNIPDKQILRALINKQNKNKLKFVPSSNILFKKTHPDAILPKYAHDNKEDSGFDFFSIEDVVVKFGEVVTIRTGWSVDIPKGNEIQIRSRSGIAWKFGVFVVNGPGTIDAGYRGEISIILSKASKGEYSISKGDKIAQGVFARVKHATIKETSLLTNSKRGENGFGSTGK